MTPGSVCVAWLRYRKLFPGGNAGAMWQSDIFRHPAKRAQRTGPFSEVLGRLQKLPSLPHPADQNPDADTYRECRYNCFNGMSLQALFCVIKKLFSSIAALFCETPCYSYAILKCIPNSRCR